MKKMYKIKNQPMIKKNYVFLERAFIYLLINVKIPVTLIIRIIKRGCLSIENWS